MSELLLGNRFRVLAELGEGAMGAVFRVADTLDGDREMALKRLLVKGAITRDMRLRFKEEFRAMVRLKHPNTIEVFGFGQLDEASQYLTMEVVEGQELTELARGETRPALPLVYDWLTQLLQALGFIHSRYYVHRDIKAQNVRVTPDGRLKLMDFGLMGRLGVNAKSSVVTGTPGYMPPEAITGGVITASSDLYAVGCLAYELLTGRLPFEGRVMEVVRAHVNEAPPPLRELAPGVPAALELIVDRLLAKDPADRYRDAAGAIADLALVSGLEVARENLDQKTCYLVASSLVGREGELAALEADLAAARLGQGRAIYLGAPAGMGKSRLLREVMLQAQWQDMVILNAQCLASGLDPLQPLAQATLPLLAVSTDDERETHQALFSRLFPAQFPPSGRVEAGPGEQLRLRESLARWLASVSTRVPLLLALEDIHLADLPTLEALNDLIPRLDGLRILVLATFRNDETPPGSAAWYSINEGLARFSVLAPLSEAQVVQLVQAMLGRVALPEAFGRFLYPATAGNAFYVTEMLRYLMEERVLIVREGIWQLPDDLSQVELPASVEDTVLRRLQQLGPRARQVATTAAVMGRYQDRAALLAVSSMEEDDLFAALDELIERQFLLDEEHRYSFPQDRVREALYGEMPEGERRRLHELYARHLETNVGVEHALSELAYHFSRGEDLQKAFAYQRQLGDQSRQEGLIPIAVKAWLQATEHLEAIDHPDKEAILGRLRLDVGVFGFDVAPQEAIAALDKAFPYFEAEAGRVGDETSFVTLTQCMAALAGAYGCTGEPAVALAMADLLATVGHPVGSPLKAAARAVYCSGLFPAGHFDALVATAKEASAALMAADLTGNPPLVWASRVVAASHQNAVAYQGYRPDEALRDYALAAAAEMKAYNLTIELGHAFAIWNAWTGREDAAIALMEELVQTARHVGAPPSPHVLYLRPYIMWQRGELDDALALVRQALRYPHVDQALVTKRMIEVLLGTILHEQGDLDGAEAILWPVEGHARQAGLDFVRIQALLALGRTLLAQGDRENGVMALEIAETMTGEGPARNPLHHALALRSLAELAIAERSFELANSRLTRALAIAADPGQANPLLEAHLKSTLGSMYEAQGRPDAARLVLNEAATSYQRSGHRNFLHPVQQRLESLANAVAPHLEEAPREATRMPSFLRDTGLGGQGW